MAENAQNPVVEEPKAENAGQPLYAYQRVGAYSPISQASEKAQHFYSMAKEYSPTVKSGLEKAEAGVAHVASAVWPYVEPVVQKIDPTAQQQLDYVEGIGPALGQKITALQTRAHELVAAADKSVDNMLPAEEAAAQETEEDLELKEAHERSLRGEIYGVSHKLAARLYTRAAANVSAAHAYTMSFAPAPENLNSYVEYADRQKEHIRQSLASTQAYLLSAVQDVPTAANSKIDELRKTAAVQTAMDLANSLTTGMANLKASSYKVPESVSESVTSLTQRLQAYYTSLRAGDDKLQVTATLRHLTDDTLKMWETLKSNVMSRIVQTPGPVAAESESTQ